MIKCCPSDIAIHNLKVDKCKHDTKLQVSVYSFRDQNYNMVIKLNLFDMDELDKELTDGVRWDI